MSELVVNVGVWLDGNEESEPEDDLADSGLDLDFVDSCFEKVEVVFNFGENDFSGPSFDSGLMISGILFIVFVGGEDIEVCGIEARAGDD